MPLIKPPPLKPGDTIAFVAPAGDLIEKHMMLARQRLEDRGYTVLVPEDLFRRHGYLAGTDARRAEELMEAFTDPRVDAVFPGTGGYGTTRILRDLDYEAIRSRPKVLIGFSDITGLHLALHRHAGVVTYHTPNPQWGLGSEDGLQPDAADAFWTLLEGRDGEGFAYPALEPFPIRTVSPGKAVAPVIGGNLSLIAATMGTPWEIDTRGRILIIEDVREAPYRIDRFFAQLRDAGKLEQAAGIIVGQFTKCDADNPEESFTVDQLVDQYFAGLGKPVIANFPFGHLPTNLSVPLGVPVELDADAGTVRLLEPATAGP